MGKAAWGGNGTRHGHAHVQRIGRWVGDWSDWSVLVEPKTLGMTKHPQLSPLLAGVMSRMRNHLKWKYPTLAHCSNLLELLGTALLCSARPNLVEHVMS